MNIKETLGLNNAQLITGDELTKLGNFCLDTRKIEPGCTFLGLQGEKVNGSSFYQEALKKGAKTLILADISLDETILTKYPDRNIILTDNVLEYMIEVAKKKRASLNIPVIAVTGSVGKTSTRNIIANTLSIKYKVLKTSANLNTNIGLAMTLLSHKDEEVIVLEMGMNHFGEIRELTNIARPTLAVITNIGTAHIGYLGSRENILKAKLEILEGLSGPVIINNDNDLLHAWHEQNTTYQVITYGIDTPSDYQAQNLTIASSTSHFTLGEDKVTINVSGRHFIYNSLVAFAVGDIFAIPHYDIIAKLTNIPLEKNRLEIISKSHYTIINDAYNSSYDSLYYALEVLSTYQTKKIAILGDILELGNFGEEIHRQIGPLITQNNIDILITIGNLSKFIGEEALNHGFNPTNYYHFSNHKEALNIINNNKEGSTILIKASNGMHLLDLVAILKEDK